MALTLEKYAEHLDGRADLNWPMPPELEPAKAKPYLKPMPEIRAVTWSLYGTLIHISEGELLLEHPQDFVMNVALDKTVQEFKMWKSMSRKAMKPAEQLQLMMKRAIDELRFQGSGAEKFPEMCYEKIWEIIVNRLLQNEYVIQQSFYGPVEEYAKKIAYFYHRSLQGTACFPKAADTMTWLSGHLDFQGIYADAQCFSCLQLERGLVEQDPSFRLHQIIPSQNRVLSCELRGRKPSETLIRDLMVKLKHAGVEPKHTLHVGTHLENDLIPLKRLGFRTALFAGDRHAVHAEPEHLKDKSTRPELMLTELSQIIDVIEG